MGQHTFVPGWAWQAVKLYLMAASLAGLLPAGRGDRTWKDNLAAWRFMVASQRLWAIPSLSVPSLLARWRGALQGGQAWRASPGGAWRCRTPVTASIPQQAGAAEGIRAVTKEAHHETRIK